MSITVILLLLICLANLSLGLFVLLRNPQARTGQSFFILTLFINAYAIANYLTDNATDLSSNILFNKLAYLFAFLALVTATLFSRWFVERKNSGSVALRLGLVAAIAAISIFSVSELVAGTVTKQNGTLYFHQGNWVGGYAFILILLLASIIGDQYYLIKRGSLLQKNQAKIIIGGFSASILVALITNALIPLISSDFQTAKFGPPLLSLLLVTSVTYAIVRHQLFDIRPVVARSFAYVLSILFLGIIYAAIAFSIAHYLFKDSAISSGQRVFYLTLALLTAMIFQPIKRRFDKLTNSLFYRDAYDTQDFIDELNATLVRNIELEPLLKSVAKVINKYLKSDFATFAINTGEHQHLEVHGSRILNIEPVELAWLHRTIHPASTKVLITSDMTNTSSKMLAVLQGSEVAAVVALSSHKQTAGYLFLGDKKSGNIYSKQDRQMMEIVGQELAIATENSLRFEEIKRFTFTLQDKVDAATKELRAANAKLKQLDQTKDEFISMASHQLRTPLTTIKGYLSMILDGDVGKIKASEKELIQNAFDSAENMVYLIADLLNISRLQSGKFVIENKPTELAKMVDKQVQQLQELATNRKVKVIYQKPASFPVLNLDETKIRQVVMNFLDNAVYYTPAGGEVIAELEATKDSVSFKVVDTGVGVPASVQHHLFSKFYRADNARKMRPDGTGLGLYMAKKVIVAQGGAIIFKSKEGQGSTFGFTFPRAKTEVK